MNPTIELAVGRNWFCKQTKEKKGNRGRINRTKLNASVHCVILALCYCISHMTCSLVIVAFLFYMYFLAQNQQHPICV